MYWHKKNPTKYGREIDRTNDGHEIMTEVQNTHTF